MKQIRIRVSNRNQTKNKHILDVKNVVKSNKIRFIRKKIDEKSRICVHMKVDIRDGVQTGKQLLKRNLAHGF